MKALALALALLTLSFTAIADIPAGVKPVTGFELDRYLGRWYEIARLDMFFERGLSNVTATYSMNDNGTVKVANRGYSEKSNKWKDANGKAKFAGDTDLGELKVSFFGPFYAPYIVFDLDQEDYQYAFVTGSKDSLWLLSRTPTISTELKERFVSMVESYGYDTNELIFVEQGTR